MALPADSHETLEGTLERFVYRDAASSFVVARLQVPDAELPVTIVGELVGLSEGLPVRLKGAWVQAKKWGRQFKVASYQLVAPETLVGIERFLASGLIAGIGPQLAHRIVEHFGHATLDTIVGQPDRLCEVAGIGPARASNIAAALVEQRHLQDVMVFLHSHGISAAFATRIVRHYGGRAVALIQENPYRLARDIWGIGFRTADDLALKLGVARTAQERLEAGLLFTLDQATEDGHVHLPLGELLARGSELLRVPRDTLEPALQALATSELVQLEPLGERGPCVALPSLWAAETSLAERLVGLTQTAAPHLALDIDAALAEYERTAGLELVVEQRAAIRAAVLDKCTVITGGPGVGKTTIIRAVVHIFKLLQRRVVLAAPTGRAAKRLMEATRHEATTIHRLLDFQPATGQFGRTQLNPLEADLVVIDEASMIDCQLASSLLQAIPPTAQLIFVGDIDQLPSVGAGAVLTDLIASEVPTVCRLVSIFRQAAQSRIVTTAHAINHGEFPELSAEADSDFFFIERSDPQRATETVVELVTERIPQRFGYKPLADIQVLAPMHRGDAGTVALNAALQARLCPDPAAKLVRGDSAFGVGDKVMQRKNDYDKQVYNGDIGFIVEVTPEALRVDFTDAGAGGLPRLVEYGAAELDQLQLAYAVSIHKSQGSEYPCVVMPLVNQHHMMLERSLVYTAITRGKKLVILVGAKAALAKAIRTTRAQRRHTWLAERLRQRAAAIEAPADDPPGPGQ